MAKSQPTEAQLEAELARLRLPRVEEVQAALDAIGPHVETLRAVRPHVADPGLSRVIGSLISIAVSAQAQATNVAARLNDAIAREGQS